MRSVLNIDIDGHLYVKGFLGLDLFASDAAKRNASRYEEVVDYILKFLWGKFTSYHVLLAIHRKAPKRVTIKPVGVPRVTTEEQKLMQNYPILQGAEKERAEKLIKQQVGSAQAIPKNWNPTMAKGSKIGHVNQQNEVEYEVLKNNGIGSDVTIDFNPGVYADAGGPGHAAAGFSSDEVLFHELVHAMSCVEGTQTKSVPFQGEIGEYLKDSFDDLEEFTAMVIANVYRSECERPGLRGSHKSGNLTELNCTGQEFYNFYQKDMQQICTFHPMLAKDLKRAVNIPFNPFVYCQV